ncbi:hypothetical protein VIMS_00488 [Mycobacterium marinum]|nr:hypothetical protein VIMS_00488 [Mycobacterium marinum]
MAIHLVDDHREKPVEQRDDIGRRLAGDQFGGADDVDKNHGDVAFFAAEFGPFPFGRDRHLAPDVAAKQVAHSFTLAQSVDHRVETAL